MSSPLVLENASLVGAGAHAAPSSILIEDGRIAALSPSRIDRPDAKRLDLGGLYVLPGLIDAHTHPFLADANISRLESVPPTLMTARAANVLHGMVLRGFTSIRDAAGGDWGVKQAVEEGEIVGPRMFIAGRALSQTGGHGDFGRRTEASEGLCACSHALSMTSRIADGVDDVRRAVRDEFRKGADQIKIMVSGGVSSPNDPLERDQYSFEEIKTVVEEAERRGSYVMAHAYGASAIKTALRAGVRSIEHGNFIDREGADLAAEKGAFIVPTLVTYEALADGAAIASDWSPAMLDKLKRVRERGLLSIELCKAAGAQIGFGTDLLGDQFFRQSEEFAIRSQIQSPAEILDSATTINARLLQKEGELGAVAVGAIADLIAVARDPLSDLSVLSEGGDSMALILKEGAIIKDEIKASPG